MFDPKVNKAIEGFSDELAEQFPEVGAILEGLKNGDIERDVAIGRLMDIVAQQGIGDDIARVAEGAFASLKAQGNQMVPDPSGAMPPIVYKGVGQNLPMMNPLLEAAIHERAQYDGDVPEMRSGPMLTSVMPAVPVKTEAQDLSVVGDQLKTASEEVKADLEEAGRDYLLEQNRVVKLLLAEPDNNIDDEETAITEIREKPWLIRARPADGVPGYETGKLPATRDVGTPTGAELAVRSEGERQESTWRALSTTQGRRSVLQVLEDLVQTNLTKAGLELDVREMGRTESVPVYAEWTVQMGGAEATQSQFSFLATAAASLCRQIREQLDRVDVPDPVLEVFPVNTVDIRKVGWGARVVSR